MKDYKIDWDDEWCIEGFFIEVYAGLEDAEKKFVIKRAKDEKLTIINLMRKELVTNMTNTFKNLDIYEPAWKDGTREEMFEYMDMMLGFGEEE